MKEFFLAIGLVLSLASCAAIHPVKRSIRMSAGSHVIEAITFASDPGEIYIPLEEAEAELGELRPALSKTNRTLTDGTSLISLADLEEQGFSVEMKSGENNAIVTGRWKSLHVKVGAKRTEVSLSEQRLRAWQGERLVLLCRISSGRNGRTPKGDFHAGSYKARRHYSSLYDNAPMPWSVQVKGNVFIHGFSSVPDYPASHGCIRVPLKEGNPAKFFYEWVEPGTPIKVH